MYIVKTTYLKKIKIYLYYILVATSSCVGKKNRGHGHQGIELNLGPLGQRPQGLTL